MAFRLILSCFFSSLGAIADFLEIIIVPVSHLWCVNILEKLQRLQAAVSSELFTTLKFSVLAKLGYFALLLLHQ